MAIVAAIGAPFVPSWDQLRPFSAEAWLIATMVAVLIAPFFTRRANLVCGSVALAGVLLALLSLLVVGAKADVTGAHFRGMLVFDRAAFLWKVVLLLFVAGVVLMWFATVFDSFHDGDAPEFFTLLLGAALGMCLMASTSNLLMIFISVELASLPSYVMAGFRKTHRIGAEASLKYVLFGAVSSSIMVYGMSVLYGLYGTLEVRDLAITMTHSGHGAALIVVALFGLIIGIGFKIAAVPVHFWCPDVFEGASIDVTMFLSVASKGAGLLLLLRIVQTIGNATNFSSTHLLSVLAGVIGMIGAVTATAANTGAFVQTNIKRLLAYSSIAHAGYMMCAVSLLVRGRSAQPGFDPAGAAAQSILLYLAVYALMNLGAFTVAAMVSRESGETLEDFAGLGRRSPLLAACMLSCLISLIGLPPFAGFGAKINVMWVLLENGGWWWALVVVIGVNTIVSAFYYLRVVRAMYLQTSDRHAVRGNPLGIAIGVVCSVGLVLLLAGFSPLSRITTSYGQLFLGGTGPAQPAPMVAMKR